MKCRWLFSFRYLLLNSLRVGVNKVKRATEIWKARKKDMDSQIWRRVEQQTRGDERLEKINVTG